MDIIFFVCGPMREKQRNRDVQEMQPSLSFVHDTSVHTVCED